VVVTGSASQLVTMRLRPGEEIGEEVHEHGDQVLLVVEGEADVVLEGAPTRLGANGLA
jgi:mannose-6-phosphate isomerase-like protein (cupin superfamily)